MLQTESDADALLGLAKLVHEGLLCRPELTPPADRPRNGGSDDMAPVNSDSKETIYLVSHKRVLDEQYWLQLTKPSLCGGLFCLNVVLLR